MVERDAGSYPQGRVAYLFNTFPIVSGTFLRREIHALERLGLEVVRVSIRPSGDRLVDPADVAELGRTTSILAKGLVGLLPSVVALILSRPLRCAHALALAVRLSRGSETGVFRHLAYFMEACWLVRFCAREQVGHVHAHFATNPPLVAMLARELGGPGFSFTMHNLADDAQGLRLKLREKVGAARFVVAVSEYGRSQTARLSEPADAGKIVIVHCGLDEDFFAAARTPPSAGPDLLFVGRLCKEKQPMMLLDAAARLVEQGVDFRLRIGGSGELEPEVRRRVESNGLSSRCMLLGSLDNVAVMREIEACRVLVLPSYTEGLPLVLMEALARGRPVISTLVAGIPELVRDGSEGWLVSPRDVDGLAGAMKAALAAGMDDLQRMGESGARRVYERHHVDDSAQRLLALFSPFCAPRGAGSQ